MTFPPSLVPCPECSALVAGNVIATEEHVRWHERTGTLAIPASTVRATFRTLLDHADDAPTQRMSPITDTVRRRPPVPANAPVRQLQGAELLHELGRLLEAGEFDDDPPCTAIVGQRACGWPDASPCLGYGVDGCGMKAQES